MDEKRIPNIAEELAKNRNIVRGTSPSSSLSTQVSATPAFSPPLKSESESRSPEPADLVIRKDAGPRRTQVKISSLLSPNGDINAPLPSQSKSETGTPPVTHTSLLMPAAQLSNAPKVILPTQLPGSVPPETDDSSSETNGVLIARISSPVSVPPQAHLKRSASSVAGEHKQPAERAQKSNTIGALPPRSKQARSTGEPKKRGAPKTGVKRENSSSGTKKDVSTNSKKNSTKKDGNTNPKKDSPLTISEKDISSATIKKDDTTTALKKENSSLNVRGESSTPVTSKSNEKDEKKEVKTINRSGSKKESNGNGGPNSNNGKQDAKKKPPVKKENAPSAKTMKTPKRLVTAPPLKSPSLLEVLERGKTQEEPEEPALIVDVPLYSAETNEYLDENGQVVFNFYKVVQDKFSSDSGTNLADLKIAKRNLFGHISGGHLDGAAEEDDEDIEEVDEDGEDDEDEEGEESKQNTSPKKKSHPNKGKSLIGKYDTEDPFIDDTELLWEEQRAATKDGFFVYFGPLIEKGHYASLERADGTMKRGGVKNK